MDERALAKARCAHVAAWQRREEAEMLAEVATSKGEFRSYMKQAEAEGKRVRKYIRLVKNLMRGKSPAEVKSGRPRK